MPMIKVDSKHMEGLKKAEWSKLDQNWKTFSIKRKNLFVEINDNEFIKCKSDLVLLLKMLKKINK